MSERESTPESQWRGRIIEASHQLEDLEREGAQIIIGSIKQIGEIRKSGELSEAESLTKPYDAEPFGSDYPFLNQAHRMLIESLSKAVGVIDYKTESGGDENREWARLTIGDEEKTLLVFHVDTAPGIVIESSDLNLDPTVKYLSSPMKPDYGLVVTERFVSFVLKKAKETSKSGA